MHGIRLALALACAIWSGAALAQDIDQQRVDVALVLTVDASGSIDTPEFQLQKEESPARSPTLKSCRPSAPAATAASPSPMSSGALPAARR